MNYVISDIHGDYDRYKKMLELIDFSEDDILYVLGDVIDRGNDGIKILSDMMLRPNVYPILGNHEVMFEQCAEFLMSEVTDDAINKLDIDKIRGVTEWMSVGGDATLKEFSKLSKTEKEDIIEYLSEFANYEIVEAGGKIFILVHAGLNNFSTDRDLDDYSVNELVFNVPDYNKIYFEKAYLVTGHLPTFVTWANEAGIDFNTLKPEEGKYEIIMKNNHIAIDCGCGHGGKLGCVCLDNMNTFYV